jgi:hypothetical protein
VRGRGGTEKGVRRVDKLHSRSSRAVIPPDGVWPIEKRERPEAGRRDL